MREALRKLVGTGFLLSALTGCVVPSDTDSSAVEVQDGMYAVVVGMDVSSFAGDCPGAEYDATRMYALISNYTTNAVLLLNSDATVKAVKNALTVAISKGKHVFFFYSGHGGNYAFPDTVGEDDGMDEYLCLYDNYMRDNDVWSIISKANGRVHLVFDCCHSATMYRTAKPFSMDGAVKLGMSKRSAEAWSMLCWSGCPDDTYSYGSTAGGKMTNTILKYYKAGLTYEQLWDKVSSDTDLKRYELVQRTEIGEGFKGKKVFE